MLFASRLLCLVWVLVFLFVFYAWGSGIRVGADTARPSSEQRQRNMRSGLLLFRDHRLNVLWRFKKNSADDCRSVLEIRADTQSSLEITKQDAGVTTRGVRKALPEASKVLNILNLKPQIL